MAESEERREAAPAFFPLLKKILTHNELTSSLKLKDVVGSDSLKEIKSAKLKDEEKMHKVLKLIENSDSSEKWGTLSEVLTSLGFVFVPKALTREHSQENFEKIKSIVFILSQAKIDTEKLAKVLLDHHVISEADVQEVSTECINMDENAGLIVLIDRAVTPPPDEWYDEFVQCLGESGHQNLVSRLQQSNDQAVEEACGGSMEGNTTYSVYDHWQKMVMELFNHQIVTCVKASEILTNLAPIFDDLVVVRSIRQVEFRKSEQEAMQLLLEKFDQIRSPGKWSAFRTALDEADYQFIINAIEGDYVNFEDHKNWERMISLFYEKLVSNVIPSSIMRHLINKRVISESEAESIEKEERHRGESHAMFELLTCIPKRHPQWYHEFMDALFLNGWEHIVREVDDDTWKALNQKHNDGKLSEDMSFTEECSKLPSTYTHNKETTDKKTYPSKWNFSDHGDVKETHVSYSEKPAFHNNNLSAPDFDDNGSSLLSTTMQELSMDDNNLASVDITREKQIARSLLPPPAKRNQPNLDLLPRRQAHETDDTENNEFQPPTSMMFRNVLGSLDREVGEDPDMNIQVNVFEEMEFDESDTEEDERIKNVEKIELRSYQQELASPGLQGKNCIIVAPTGSGKTHVAMKIILEHMRQVRARRHPKVVFLVEQSALAEQQAKLCRKYLPYHIKLITGEVQRNERQKSFSEWLKRKDILVVTAQLLVNALLEKDVEIENFTLMVFDECHHAHAKHSYNQIMQNYMDVKFKDQNSMQNLPKIVGLTASVGVGRTKTTEGAIVWIKTMMANLDAEELATVRDQRDELSEHVIVPEQMIKQTAPRKKNYFGDAVTKIMEVTEKYMKQSEYAESLTEKDKILKAPPGKGSEQYTQWISKLWRETAKIFNQDARRFFSTCRTYLDLYNRALIVYEDARVKDALDFLEENIQKVNDHIVPDQTDEKMISLYQKSKKLLEHCVHDVEHENPKLETLRNMIGKTYKKSMDSRGIIFVKTRDLTQAIMNWMKDTEGLKSLNPTKFVGAQAAGEKGGMTKNDQDNILRFFKDGKHKIIIATSVAEEGLDIQKCNLVIRYDYVTNEIAMVQARGRGRAEGSQYYVVAGAEKKTAQKEELNMMREARMNEAIIHLQDEIRLNKNHFLKEIKDLQLEANLQREMENSDKGRRVISDYEFEMRCGKCGEYICMSRDIKKIQNAHHVVIGDEIADHIKTVRMPKPTFEDENVTMGVGKVNCGECGKNLGNISIYKKAQFPVLKIENFVVADSRNNTDIYKRWKNAPFTPAEISTSDLRERVNGRMYIPLDN